MADKTSKEAGQYLPLLGLVDSEAWAWGRLNTLRLRGGKTIRERYLAWQFRGCPDEEPVAESEFEEAFMRNHAPHEELRRYWDALRQWQGTRRFNLDDVASSAV